MSAVPKPRKLTEAEYLEIERAAEFKSEFYDGVMYPMQGPPGFDAAVGMAGATYPHNRIKDNLARHIGNRLADGPCFPMTSDMRVDVGTTGLRTYPDILIVCGEPEFADAARDAVLNPKVIFEVLSPSTEKYDRGKKFDHYRQIPSLMEYVLVAQDEPVCERFVRQPDGSWNLTAVSGLGGELALATVPARVPLADVYAGVTFPDLPLR